MADKRAIIYARVSTEDQAKRGYSLPSQLDECRRYCAREGYTIAAEYSEDESGARLDRPALTKARDMLRAGQADALIVLASDRLTRSLAHQLLLREEFQRGGVELIYVQRGGKLDNTPEATLTDNMAGVIAEYEREKIRERATRGIWTKASQGRVVGMGGAPYGYRFEAPGTLTPHEPEAGIVHKIYKWYTEGDETGARLAAYAIARRLTLSKVPTPAEGNNKRRRLNPACAWNTYTINTILANETYAGVYRFGLRQQSNTRRAPIEIQVAPLISRETWTAARTRATLNKANARRNTRRLYLLRGRITCGKCGRMMGGNHNTRSNVAYYGCRSRTDPAAVLCRCDQPGIRTTAAEGRAWEFALDVLTGDDLDAKVRDAQAHERAAVQESASRVDEINRALAELTREAAALSAEITSPHTGPLMRQTHQQRRDALEAQYAELMAELAKLEGAAGAPAITDEQLAGLHRMRAEIAAGIEDADSQTMLHIFDVLNVTAKATGYNVTVSVQLGSLDISGPIVPSIPRSAHHNPCITLSRTFDLTEAHANAARRRP